MWAGMVGYVDIATLGLSWNFSLAEKLEILSLPECHYYLTQPHPPTASVCDLKYLSNYRTDPFYI